MRKPVSGSNMGFTLIELLVVIAVIAILAAIMIPAYLFAKSAAQTAKCLAHLKELYGAMEMYMGDYNYWLPNENFLTYFAPSPNGPRPLYWPYVKNREILICQKTGGYGYNIALKAPVDYTAWAYVGGAIGARVRVHRELGHGATDAKGRPLPHQGRPVNDVKYPSRMMAFVCGQPGARVEEGSGAVQGEEGNGWEWEPHDVGMESSARMEGRHKGGTTYAFVDGHVRCLRPTGTKYGFPMATDGLDYDGDGTLGDVDFMR